jgi:hypothetical protein
MEIDEHLKYTLYVPATNAVPDCAPFANSKCVYSLQFDPCPRAGEPMVSRREYSPCPFTQVKEPISLT